LIADHAYDSNAACALLVRLGIEPIIRRSMIESMVKTCLARSAYSRGRRDVNASRDHRVPIGSAPMEAARIPLLHPQVLDESARERRIDLERLRDDLLRLLLPPEISFIDRIGSEHDRQLEFTDERIKPLGHKERRKINISDRRRCYPQPRRFLHQLGS